MPRQLTAWLKDPDPARAARVFQAMMGMKRIQIAQLAAAAEAKPVAGAAPITM